MEKYRKKPVVIEAVQITEENIHTVAKWCGGEVKYANYEGTVPSCIDLSTLESANGTQRADMGDYIIRGVDGEFYPCKPGIFQQTYFKEAK